MSTKEHPPLHVPVLLDATIDQLDPKEGERYLDLTAGYGGHAEAILVRTKNYVDSCLVDRDSFAIATLDRFGEKGTRIIRQDFVSAGRMLIDEHWQFDVILLDLGVSSPQLDRPERGFSFTHSGPLDMRMDQTRDMTAETIVNSSSEAELIRIIREYGEEPFGAARRYARAIVQARPLYTTGELAEVIAAAHVGRWQRIHPATRTFQALRIMVNQELAQVEEILPLLPQLLARGGRVGVISFHSLEDRLVKRYFTEQARAGYETELAILTKKPIAGDTYDVHNPRSRSAKLRVAVKK